MNKAIALRRVSRTWDDWRRRWFHAWLRTAGVEIGAGCSIALGSRVSPKTSFGQCTKVNGPCVFKGEEPIRIGKYCAIADGVRVISSNHGTDWLNLQYALQHRLGFPPTSESRGPVTIGNNVWIGDAAIILAGVTVGDGAAIGAGSIVTRDVPAFAVAVGAPARVIRMRFSPEVIASLEWLKWWDWTEDEMRARPDLFSNPLSSPPSHGHEHHVPGDGNTHETH